MGAFIDNKPWNISEYNHEGKIVGRYNNGVRTIFINKGGVLYTQKEDGFWVWYESNEISNTIEIIDLSRIIVECKTFKKLVV